ncbi:p53-induced death domain-containing protein 1-like isoform X2 [Ptychodera flava]
MSNLENLKCLILNGNNFRAFPKVVLELSHLGKLDISDNRMIDLPDDMSSLDHLIYLDVRKNRLSSKSMANVATVRNLIIFLADENAIDSIPVVLIRDLQFLMVLSLKKNSIRKPNPEICAAGVDRIREYVNEHISPSSPVSGYGPPFGSVEKAHSPDEEPHKTLENKYGVWKIPVIRKEEGYCTEFTDNFIMEFPPESVSGSWKKKHLEVVTTTSEDGGPDLVNNEHIESDIITFSPVNTSFAKPVTIGYRVAAYDVSREIVILRSYGDRRWRELQTTMVKDSKGYVAKTKVTSVSMFLVVSKPLRKQITVSKTGGEWKSSSDDNIMVEVPPDTVQQPTIFTLEVNNPDSDIVSDVQPAEITDPGSHIDFGSKVSLKNAEGRTQRLSKAATLSIPLPGLQKTRSDLHILQEDEDGSSWDDITDTTEKKVEEKYVSFETSVFTGYRTAYVPGGLTIDELVQSARELDRRQTKGIYFAKMLLLQSTKTCFDFLVDVVEQRSVTDRITEYEQQGFKRGGSMCYTRDVEIRKGESIIVTVGGDFRLDCAEEKSVFLTFIPRRNNHSPLRIKPCNDDTGNGTIDESQLKGFVLFERLRPNEPDSEDQRFQLRLHFVVDVPESVVRQRKEQSPKRRASFSVAVRDVFRRFVNFFTRRYRGEFVATMTTLERQQSRDSGIDRAIEIVIEHLRSDNWKLFGRQQLEISDENIDNIDDSSKHLREKKYQMLRLWRELNGSDATVERLITLANEAGHRQLEEKLQLLL